MTRATAALVAMLVVAACGSEPRTMLAYKPTAIRGGLPPGTLVVTRPYDDRYDSERAGETRSIRYAVVSISGGMGAFRGNSVTSDLDFAADAGPFGTLSIADGVGNLIVKGLSHDSQSVVAASAPLTWQCTGSCTPAPGSVRAIATQLHARYVLATRVVHLYAMQYAEREFSVASTETKQGNITYKVTTSTHTERASANFGSCVLELSLFEIQDGQIVNTTRWSSASSRVGRNGTDQAHVAAAAVGHALDDARRRLASSVAEPAPELPAAAPSAPAVTPAPSDGGPGRRPSPGDRPKKTKKAADRT